MCFRNSGTGSALDKHRGSQLSGAPILTAVISAIGNGCNIIIVIVFFIVFDKRLISFRIHTNRYEKVVSKTNDNFVKVH